MIVNAGFNSREFISLVDPFRIVCLLSGCLFAVTFIYAPTAAGLIIYLDEGDSVEIVGLITVHALIEIA